jgi:hypothetical protein
VGVLGSLVLFLCVVILHLRPILFFVLAKRMVQFGQYLGFDIDWLGFL